MKHTLFILIIAVISLASSCKDPLQIADPNWLEEENFYKTENDALLGLVGVFDAFQGRALMGKNYREFDIITDNATYRSGSEWRDIESDLTTPTTAKVSAFWTDYYLIVSRANRVIDKVSSMSDNVFKNQSKVRIIAEAAFLRAYAYHDLTAIWGNVPFPTRTKNGYDNPESATSKQEIHTYIINDLINSIIPNLPPTLSSANEKGRVTKAAAQALLGKYYLAAKNWTKAAETFWTIIDSKQYKLHPSFADLFTEAGEFSSENLFEINFTGKGADIGEYFSTRVDISLAPIWPSSQIVPTTDLVSSFLCTDGRPIANHTLYGTRSPLYVPGTGNTNPARYQNRDPRLRASIYTNADVTASNQPVWQGITISATNNVNNFAIKKYSILSNQQYANGGPQNYYVIRYAEVLLAYAEAKNEELAGPDQSVRDAINEVRQRVGMPTVPTTLTKDQMRQYIRDERRWEFAFEHQRFFDLKRWEDANGKPLLLTVPPAAMSARKKASEPKVYTWPYPQEEMDGNGGLRAQGQNAGYF